MLVNAKNKENLILISLISLLLIIYIFEVIFYEDRILPNLLTLHALRSLQKLFNF